MRGNENNLYRNLDPHDPLLNRKQRKAVKESQRRGKSKKLERAQNPSEEKHYSEDFAQIVFDRQITKLFSGDVEPEEVYGILRSLPSREQIIEEGNGYTITRLRTRRERYERPDSPTRKMSLEFYLSTLNPFESPDEPEESQPIQSTEKRAWTKQEYKSARRDRRQQERAALMQTDPSMQLPLQIEAWLHKRNVLDIAPLRKK